MRPRAVLKTTGLLVAVLSLLAVSACRTANSSAARSIFGTDDRQDLFEVDDPLVDRLARSTVMLVRKSKIKDTGDGYYELTGKRAAELQFEFNGKKFPLCPERLRFAEQFSVGYCSGALVADDPKHGAVIGSVGHCIHNVYDCAETAVIFDYQLRKADQDMLRVPAKDVFFCSEMLASVDDFRHGNHFVDFAFFALDRPTAREPLAIASGEVQEDQDVMLIGHAWGLPGKLSRGKIRTVAPGRFGSDFDGLNGNSGSAIVDVPSGEIVGFWSNGPANDFLLDPAGNCLRLVGQADASASPFNEANTSSTFEVPGFIERSGPSLRVIGARLKQGWSTVRTTYRSEGFDGPAVPKGEYGLTIDFRAVGGADIGKVDLVLANNILVLPRDREKTQVAFSNVVRGEVVSVNFDIELLMPCGDLDKPVPRLPFIEMRAKFNDGYERVFGVRLPCIADPGLAKVQAQPTPAVMKSLKSGLSSVLYVERPVCTVAADCVCGAIARKTSFFGGLDATYPVEWLSNDGRSMVCKGLKQSIHNPAIYMLYVKNETTKRLTRGL